MKIKLTVHTKNNLIILCVLIRNERLVDFNTSVVTYIYVITVEPKEMFS